VVLAHHIGLVFPSLVAQLLRKSKVGLLVSAFCFFCGGAQGIFWALVVAAGGVLATLFIPQIRGRLLTALTWAYLQESHYLVYGIYQWGRSLKIVGTVGVCTIYVMVLLFIC